MARPKEMVNKKVEYPRWLVYLDWGVQSLRGWIVYSSIGSKLIMTLNDIKNSIADFIYGLVGLDQHVRLEREVDDITKRYRAESLKLKKWDTLREQLSHHKSLGLYETMICSCMVDHYDHLSLQLRIQGSEWLSDSIRRIHRTH